MSKLLLVRLSFLYRGVLLHEAIFLVHHHCRINSNEQRHLPYPNCSRRRLLHLLAYVVPPVASAALFSLPRVPIRATTHRLSVLCREGAVSSFSLSNDSKSMTAVLLSLPFRSIDRPNHSSISSAEVNRRQTFTVVDNIAISFLQVHWPLFKICVLHRSLILLGHDSLI
ncbi:hypothetical protein B296_00057806 [Ensete ventricosum]|uniref:Uncharacterized protein n=1 Tax=Ensete ventricosum TaxID=4639 RepID=A0A426XDW6_ENSVE|nr:hypothetical protein B296_00057806 [Ensete ventricosum]